jgi:hypothetical protein
LHYAARSKVKLPPKPKEKDAAEEDFFGNQPGAAPGLKVVNGGRSDPAPGPAPAPEKQPG